MKSVIIVCLMVVGALAAPQVRIIPVLERSEVHDDVGQYALRYQSGDGTIVSEQGALTPTLDGRSYVLVKQGEYSFYAPNGQLFRTAYVADQHGFRAIGDHLPQSVKA